MTKRLLLVAWPTRQLTICASGLSWHKQPVQVWALIAEAAASFASTLAMLLLVPTMDSWQICKQLYVTSVKSLSCSWGQLASTVELEHSNWGGHCCHGNVLDTYKENNVCVADEVLLIIQHRWTGLHDVDFRSATGLVNKSNMRVQRSCMCCCVRNKKHIVPFRTCNVGILKMLPRKNWRDWFSFDLATYLCVSSCSHGGQRYNTRLGCPDCMVKNFEIQSKDIICQRCI